MTAIINSGDLPIAGWYGKIPSLGDFASRRLPLDFIGIWDSWLQQAMATSRMQLGECWFSLYMTSPIWRFILMPGICGNSLWAGILMPSVDKVGRCFPLMIAIPIMPHPGMLLTILSAQTWYASLERLALASLNVDISPDDLDQKLAEYPFPGLHTSSRPVPGQEEKLASWWQIDSPAGLNNCQALSLPAAGLLPELFETAADNLFTTLGFRKSIWWNVSPETGATRLHCFTGLPPENHFALLLSDGAP
jgi:type VI secretion system protein ImpM